MFVVRRKSMCAGRLYYTGPRSGYSWSGDLQKAKVFKTVKATNGVCQAELRQYASSKLYVDEIEMVK